MMKKNFNLIADIGGTNARFAIAPSGEVAIDHVQILSAADYPSITDAIRAYLSGIPEKIIEACFAVACPADEEVIQFTNSPWKFQPRDLTREFSWKNLHMANDFQALALGIPHIPSENLITLKEGVHHPYAPRAVIGPGTGLGVSGMVFHNGDWAVMAGEGGHIGFAPQDEIEIDLLRYTQKRFGRVSNERLLQGEGLVTLYRFFCKKAGVEPSLAKAAEIANSEEQPAQEAVKRFGAILGSVAGDVALMLASRGGVFIGGGIVPKLLNQIRDSALIERFSQKGRLSRLLNDIPIYVITDSCAALYGCADLLKRN